MVRLNEEQGNLLELGLVTVNYILFFLLRGVPCSTRNDIVRDFAAYWASLDCGVDIHRRCKRTAAPLPNACDTEGMVTFR